MSGDNETRTLLKICEIGGDVKGLGKDINWIKENLVNTSKILDRHDQRLSKVELDIKIIMDRRNIFFKFVRWFVSIFGWNI